jgi:hypothetical protein
MLDLESIELIKQLKARYFRFLDTRNLDGLKTVFTHDATASFIGGDYDFQLDGWEQLEGFYKKSFTGQNFGMHNGHWRIARTGYKRLWEEHHKRGPDISLRVKPIAD